jgi:alanine racemase
MLVERQSWFRRHLMRPTWVEVDLDALEHNVRSIRSLVRPQKVVGVLKGNAYGLGVEQCGLAMDEAGIDMLAVANPSEVSLLRKRGVKCPIILYPSFGAYQVDEVLELDAILSVSDHEIASAISDSVARRGRRPAQVLLKVDTGLGRLGVPYQAAADLACRIAADPHLQLVGIHSHIAGASDDKAQEQWRRLETVISDVERSKVSVCLKMIASSSHAVGFPNMRLTAIDPGRLLFGLRIPGIASLPEGLVRSVFLGLRTEIVQVKPVTEGDPDSYAAATDRYGVIPFGWYDVLLPDVYQRTGALVRGKPIKFLNRLSTQHSVVSLCGVPEAVAGDVVTIIGRDGTAAIGLSDLASAGGLLESEITERFSTQMSYVYFRNGCPSVVRTPLGERSCDGE